MARGQDSTGGIELVEEMRSSGLFVPVLIYTSPRSVAEYEEVAIKEGAKICTSGIVSLLRCLAKELQRRIPPGKCLEGARSF